MRQIARLLLALLVFMLIAVPLVALAQDMGLASPAPLPTVSLALPAGAMAWIEGGLALFFLVVTIANRRFKRVPEGQKPHWLADLNDVAAFLPRPGERGVLGPVNLPGFRSRARRPKAPLATLLAFAAIGLSMAGCATAMDGAMQARNEIGSRVTEAAKAWEQYDRDRIDEIKRTTPKFREDQEKALLAYANGEHNEAVKVFNTAWSAVVALDRAIAAARAGMAKDLPGAIASAWAALSTIAEALTKLGVKIPGVQL